MYFRDYLRSFPDSKLEYVKLKEELAKNIRMMSFHIQMKKRNLLTAY
ncbi:hypothetical protein COE31_20995 [Priestia megaterium]|nr:hypothetical protein COE31_20995 [Priestia megaterium]